jgi:intracellular sulfur oxidation DsrE/DsrF family protein
MRLLTTILAMFMAVGLFAGQATAADNGYGKQKVVYHINYDNPKAQAGALRNIQNHINAVGKDNLDLKVVLHGKGLTLLLEPDMAKNTKFAKGNADDKVTANIAALKEQGVHFQVCANTLRGKKVNFEQDLYDVSKADIVPSGVAELAKLQAEGYTYIKP